ncbi:TraB/GumN family protein [Paenibacillus sp. N3/727]|uniref:TraB/GumN family protein n=1 Tax=Paenibacillus sp. N3/727 TaxID=2925845 RepID=UPI001F53C8FA|nr:TraB/GumN family protein [Paenibacillus sp. N3/727]UNK20687.1 TraB/GumN family protein [Paenibacillus sp. N3/727]
MQDNKHWSKFRRWAGAGALSLTILLGHVFPIHADTPAAVPDISRWSISTLNEGEKYGIYPMEWYYDGTFKKSITANKFNSLMDATAKKLDLLGLKKKEASLSFTTGEVITRETVITSLHKLLANYELPESFGVTGVEPIDYMQQKGIVKGTKAGLQLDQPSTVEQAAVMASRMVEYTYDITDGGAKGLMWKVTNDKNTLYLLGSVHLGITDMYPMQKSIRDAFKASDDLWVELDLVGGDMSYFQEKMVYSDGTTLKDHVAAATYEKLQKVLTKLEVPANAFDGYKPFAVSSSLSTFAYFDNPTDIGIANATGIDRHFLTSAMLMGKPIHELEGIKLQADLFADVPDKQQEKELNAMLDTFLSESGTDEVAKHLKQMQLDWIEGDVEGLRKTLTADGQFTENEANQRLIGERDKNMALKLAELLEKKGENTSFVVVGAAHYVMEGMVVDLLKEKGYKVELVQK